MRSFLVSVSFSEFQRAPESNIDPSEMRNDPLRIVFHLRVGPKKVILSHKSSRQANVDRNKPH